MMPEGLRLVSVNVATPVLLGGGTGEPVMSAIAKRPVSGEAIEVGRTNLNGDAQADLSKHGGPDKAVYAYSADHWPWWEAEKHLSCAPGTFGENLTVTGADETAIRIGDRFLWGNAILEVAQPRVPCFKLERHAGRPDIGAAMTLSGRCGWYFRVIVPGTAPVQEAVLTRVSEGGPTVRESFRAVFDRGFDPAGRRAIAKTQALSEAWRKRLHAAGL